ncbi:MAG: S8 family serine peptidase [Candidatus Zixiibacteriota bacterium]
MITWKSIPAILILLFACSTSWAFYTGEDAAPSYQPNSLIIKFKDTQIPRINAGKQGTTTGLKAADALNVRYNVTGISPLLAKSAQSASAEKFGAVYILTVRDGADLNELQNAYAQLLEVEYAEINQIVELHTQPDDSLYQYQWSLNNTGQPHYHVVRNYGSYNDELVLVSGLPDADIDAGEIFENPPDRTVTVVVAIIDTGVDLVHPDLIDHIWINPGEIPGNGYDDDHNGYIDDVNGWDFASSSDPLDPGDNDPTDEFGHGTHCSGIIAATANNIIGMAGIGQDCRIMGLKFDPLPLVSRIAGAIIYAADNGAEVINMSFGYNYRSDLIEDAINYAHDKGVIMCASAGNEGTYSIVYPAAYDATITVGASNDSDLVATFSSYGEHLDVAAPGLSILSLRAGETDMYASSYPYEPKVHIVDSIYYMASGTSMSTPHVVGTAAVLRSISPGISADRVKQILHETADDIVDPYGVGWNLVGFDQYSGYGRVNLFRAVQALPKVRARITAPAYNEIFSGNVDIRGSADGDDFTGYTLEAGSGDDPEVWTTLHNSTDSVTDGTLVLWNTIGFSGRYTLRLTVGNENVSYVSFFIANDTQAVITSPSASQTISNFVSVRGTAAASTFSHAVMEYKPEGSPNAWIAIDTFTVPVFDDILGGWFLEGIPTGNYDLRLSLYSYGDLLSADTVTVTVQSIFETDRAWKANLAAYPTIVTTYCDFDNDGSNEILTGTSSEIMVFNPDGTAKTEGMPDFPQNNYMIPIAVGNLDGDGVDDIIAVGYDPPKVYCYRSSEGSTVNYLGIFPPIGNFYRSEHEFPKVMLKDIDSDGRDEIHVFVYNGLLSQTFLFESNGELIRNFLYYSESILLDLNGDGIDELYASNRNFGMIRQIEYATGNTVDSLLIDMNGSNFECTGMSGYDIDNDDQYELIISGYYDDYGYWVYAFDGGLNLIPGWPHDMGVDAYEVPTDPIFADMDGDSEAEYLATFFDISNSYVLAWNLDGSSFLPSSPNGTFVSTPEPSVLNMLLLADMNGDGSPDVVACANNDMFNTYEPQRIYAWDTEGRQLDGFPLIISTGTFTSDRFTPSVGDIDGDGNVDLIITTPDSVQIFVNYPGASFDICSNPAPFWRYSRKMNNCAPLPSDCGSTDVADNDSRLLPESFSLSQNYPNPFNPATTIEYALPQKTHVDISVYNILGQNITTLIDEIQSAGRYSTVWNGRDRQGRMSPSGIYFYRIKAGDYDESRKMLLLK